MSLNIIIMAGGLGKRMKSHLPKVLHIVDGIPMVVRVIKEALILKPNKIMLVTGKYKEYISVSLANFNVLKYVTFINQEVALGTGHAIQCAYKQLEKLDKEAKILVLSGDTPLISSSIMKSMIIFNDVKIMTTLRENPSGYGRIKIKNDKFIKIIEHKDCNLEELKINIVNCGIYAFKNKHLLNYLNKLNNNNKQNEYYLTDIIKIIKDYEKIDIELNILSKDKQWQLTNVNDTEQLNYVNKLKRKHQRKNQLKIKEINIE